MRLLIDGYNLMYATNTPSKNSGSGWLASARDRLIDTLLKHLSPNWLDETVIVFDAKDAPANLPPILNRGGMEIQFARDHAEADDLLEELIERCVSAERLLVVSSDHRLQKAARRRHAMTCDSDDWYDQLLSDVYQVDQSQDEVQRREHAANENVDLSNDDVREWLQVFGHADSDLAKRPKPKKQLSKEVAKDVSEKKKYAVNKEQKAQSPRTALPKDKLPYHDRSIKQIDGDVSNPFPEGYGEDVQ